MAKAQLEFNLTRNVEDNKKVFFKYIDGNKQCKNNIIPLQNEDGHLENRNRDKAEMCNAFFVFEIFLSMFQQENVFNTA